VTPAENQARLVADFSAIPDPLERLNALAARARAQPPVPEADRVDAFLVRGCQAPLWVVPECDRATGLWTFRVGSPSPVVGGLAHLTAAVYSGCAAGEIAAFETTVIADLGLDRHLTPNRRAGAAGIAAQIRRYVTGPGP
jgi:cysteine desulfuration protein SufE